MQEWGPGPTLLTRRSVGEGNQPPLSDACEATRRCSGIATVPASGEAAMLEVCVESGQSGLFPGLPKAIVPALQDPELDFSSCYRGTQVVGLSTPCSE